MLLRLNLPPSRMPLASLLLGMATGEAIQHSTLLTCDLRWPNDVLINGRKVAGILTHLVEGCIIGGVGINVNHGSLPTDLRTPATSLRIESGGRVCAREPIIEALLHSVASFCHILNTVGAPAILDSFTASSSYAFDRRVRVDETGTVGVTVGLDENGFLLVQPDSGSIERVSTGGVRPVDEP
jgi:BirA family biotin operon repressor/biotin-[acetyl-CoA-carboxylase] ligase